ncbi:HAD-IA family hydrolase [Luteococcus sp. Sow4_B9]|uniref:HAD-IA family hydrolase n=1 Tax=Luteococcus sp. Sow4_B9 TaxID=3438792 RepID=UPI003F95914C
MSQTHAVDGILFDNDGVLVNSIPTAMRIWREWAKQRSLGIDPTVDFPHGMPAREYIATLVPEGEADEAYRELDETEIAHAHEVDAIPGAAELTASLPADRWVVVTSAGRDLATARVRAAGHDPQQMVSVDDVTNGKPHPEPYLRGAELLGLEPSRVAVFEDASAGVQAARAAGVGLVVGVGDQLDPSTVDVLVPDLSSVRRLPSDEGIVLEFDV